MKEELIRLERQAKLEKEIYDEICNIQKAFQEKDRLETEEEIAKDESEEIFENILMVETNNFQETEEDSESSCIENEETKVDDIERIDEDNDTSIQVPEKERDIRTVGVSTKD